MTMKAFSSPQTLLLWDLRTKKAKSLSGHRSTVMALARSPDGKTLATAGYDGTVRLWDLATAKCRKTWKGHTGPARAIAFSPDGALASPSAPAPIAPSRSGTRTTVRCSTTASATPT